jgi:hypothetical protein
MQQQVKYEVKQRIKNSVPEEELTVFSFSEIEYKNLDWLEKNEFRCQGDMYDVVRKKTDAEGNVVIYALNDRKEKELFAAFEEQTRKKTEDPAGENMQKALELFSSPVHKLVYFIPEKSILPSFGYQFSFLSFIREIIPPPPKLA